MIVTGMEFAGPRELRFARFALFKLFLTSLHFVLHGLSLTAAFLIEMKISSVVMWSCRSVKKESEVKAC